MNCCPSGFSYGAPVCVALSTGEPVQYKTKINSDRSITYVDSAGAESSSLPVGSSVINCNQISWVANQPVTDSWLLLYDMVEEAYETTTSLYAWSTTGGVTAVGDSLIVTSDGTATITVMLPKPATEKYVGLSLGIDHSGVSIHINGEVVPNIMSASFYTDPDGEATIEFIFSGVVGELKNLMTYNSDGSIGGCKPFIRRIVDNVVTDTELDLTTPYTVGGEVRTSCPDELKTSVDSGISALLYDSAPSDGAPTYVEHVDDQTMQSFYTYNTVPHPSGGGVTFPAITQPSDYQYVSVPITNLTVGATVYVTAGFYDVPYPQPLTYLIRETGEDITKDYIEQITFVASETTHYLELFAVGVHDEFTIRNVSASTIDGSQDSCTPFFRTIKDGVVTDTDLDGQPYIVQGEVRTSCPDAQPTHTPVSVTSGSYTLAAGVKSYSITFVDEGAIRGAYRPAGYSIKADYVEQGYATALTVTGISFIIEEVR